MLDEEKAVPDIVGELDALLVELVDRAVHVEERVSQRVSNRHGNDPQHGVDRRGEVLPTEGDHCEDRPDEHSNDGDERDTAQLHIRKRDKPQHRRKPLLDDLDEDASSCEGCIECNRQNAPNERSRLEVADEKHEHEGELHEGSEIGRRCSLDPPPSSIAKEVSGCLLRLHGNDRNTLGLQEALERGSLGLRKGSEIALGERRRDPRGLPHQSSSPRSNCTERPCKVARLPVHESLGFANEILALVAVCESLGFANEVFAFVAGGQAGGLVRETVKRKRASLQSTDREGPLLGKQGLFGGLREVLRDGSTARLSRSFPPGFLFRCEGNPFQSFVCELPPSGDFVGRYRSTQGLCAFRDSVQPTFHYPSLAF